MPRPPSLLERRLRAQHLAGRPFASAVEAVRSLGAVQSQDYAGAKWGLGQRIGGATDAEIDRVFDEGRILRTHVMRPTWHFVLPEDVRWLLELTAARVKALLAVYDPRLEIDAALLKRSRAVFESALRDRGSSTRAELAAALKRARIEAAGQRLAQLVMHAELDQVIVSGPRRGRQFTYALMDVRAPRSRRLDRDESLAEIVRRYFTGHGPAQIPDFTWWSGLTVADAKRGLALAGDALQHEVIEGKSHWSGADPRGARVDGPLVHLLPNYDEYLIAYRDRTALVDPSRRLDGAPFPYGSIIAHVVVVDGRVVGGWKRVNRGREVVVELGPLDALAPDVRRALESSAEALARFLGAPVRVTGL